MSKIHRAALPAPLRPWAAALAPISTELALALGPWITRLSALFGPLHVRADIGRAEPDGYDGITRRGDPSRLLASDWLLASEAPEEFERRWAMSELGYLSVARIEPRKARGSFALLDSGPLQLGGLRVIHLAAVVALAERAARAGARFGFSMLADSPDETEPFEELSGDVLERWALARTPREHGDSDIERWIRHAGARGFEDCWVIGGPRITTNRQFSAWSRVALDEPLRVGERRVRAVVRPCAGPPSEVALDPLPDPVSAKILRDPRSVLRATPPAAIPQHARNRLAVTRPVWSASAHKVFARNAQGDLLVYPIPLTARSGGGKPKLNLPHGAEARILAAGWSRRRLVILQRTPKGLVLSDWRGDRFPLGDVLPADAKTGGVGPDELDRGLDRESLHPLYAAKIQGSNLPRALFLSPNGDLFYFQGQERFGYEALPLAKGVCALVPSRSGLLIARWSSPDTLSFEWQGGAQRQFVTTFPCAPDALWLGANPWIWRDRPVETAAHVGDRWRVEGLQAGPWEWSPGRPCDVIGVIPTDPARNDAALLVLDGDAGQLERVDRGGRTTRLHWIEGGVLHATLAPDGDKVAFVNGAGVVSTFSVSLGRELSRWPRVEVSR